MNWKTRPAKWLWCTVVVLSCAAVPMAAQGAEALPGQAETTLRRALAAMATRQWSGGWGMAWSLHGKVVWGEWRPKAHDWVCVQPPATPSIAEVYLRAGQLLDEPIFLQHARMARNALAAIRTPDGGLPHEWRITGPRPFEATFDDGVTTGALAFLVKWWQHTEDGEDLALAHSVGDFILKAQYESGGWPQRYPPPSGGYGSHITFNDGVMANVIRALLSLHEATGEARYFEAARKGGECIIALQGGPGEEIWAQQYDAETLEPAWARNFEPPGYTPAESAGALGALLELYLATGEDRFLDPLPKAFHWYETHRLENGRYARLYEPGTQRPVYGRRDKAEKVYDAEQACTGYAWQGNWYPHHEKALHEKILAQGRDAVLAEMRAPKAGPDPAALAESVAGLCDTLTDGGWWVRAPGAGELAEYAEAGVPEAEPVVRAGDFVRNANLLLDYLEAIGRAGS